MKRRGDSSTSTIEIAVDHSCADTVVRLKGRVDVDSFRGTTLRSAEYTTHIKGDALCQP